MKGKTRTATIGLAMALGLFLMIAPQMAAAHDGAYFADIQEVFAIHYMQHEEESPYKGAIDLTVTNSGTVAWGDFHFRIFQMQDGIDNIFFTAVDPDGQGDWTPVSSQSGLTWTISADGKEMDLWFYENPVLPGQTGNFRVYTDNSEDEVALFGVSFWATPVPVRGALLLFGSGVAALMGVVGSRRKMV